MFVGKKSVTISGVFELNPHGECISFPGPIFTPDVESYIEKELVTRISDLHQQLTVIRSQLEKSHKVWLFFSLISFVLGMWA